MIPRKVNDHIPKRPKLHEAKAKLTSYNGGNIKVQGKCIVRITRPDKPGKSYPVQCLLFPLNHHHYVVWKLVNDKM